MVDHYRWDFIGLSTDDKPTATDEKVTNGSTFYESDTSKYYIWYNDQWYEKIVNGGGTVEPGSGEVTITEYDNTSKTITGTGFGEHTGLVYLLDRDSNSYVSLTVTSWKNDKVVLSSSINLGEIEGNTSLNIVTSDGIWSTKVLIEGALPVEGWGKVYLQKVDSPCVGITLENQTEFEYLSTSSNMYAKDFTLDDVTYYQDEIVGFQFGEDFDKPDIGNSFLCNCIRLNQPLIMPSNATKVGTYFLNNAKNFNQILKFGYAIRSGDNFMSGLTSFNQPLDLTNVTLTGYYSLNSLSVFNQPLTLPESFHVVGLTFGENWYSFNQPIDISHITTFSGSMFKNAYVFDQPLTFNESVTVLPTDFLSECHCYNQKINLANITTIGGNFLVKAYKFNNEITMPKVTSVGDYFLSNCVSFNKPLDTSKLTTIGASFLYYCGCFNQSLDLSSLTSIGNYFMSNCMSFNKPLTLPSTVTSVGTYFCNHCMTFDKLTVNCTAHPSDNYSLSTTANTYLSYVRGITVDGDEAATWLTALPNRTSSPYRKLIDGTE